MQVNNAKKIGWLLVFILGFQFAAKAQVSDTVKRKLFNYLVANKSIVASDLVADFSKAAPHIKEVRFYPDSSCASDQHLYKFLYLASYSKSYYCLIKGEEVTFLRTNTLHDLLEDVTQFIGSIPCKPEDKSVDLLYRKVMNGYQMYRYKSNAGY